MKVGDLVKHNSFDDLYGVVTDIRNDTTPIGTPTFRIEVLWCYDPGYGQHTAHHPDRLEVISESR